MIIAGRSGRHTGGVRALVVEDEVALAKLIRQGLIAEGWLADVAVRGEDAVWMVETDAYDVMCLDVNLPGIDGFEVCRRVREHGAAIPILMLTARDGVADRIAGLDYGADDYLTKPFDFGELVARLRALSRRSSSLTPSEVLTVGDLTLDLGSRRVTRGEVPIDLSTKEIQVLEVFLRSPGIVLTRTQILERAWDSGYEHRSNVVDVYIRYLREKIDRPFGCDTLTTVRGAGYRLDAPAD